MKVTKIREKGIEGACISYGRSDKIYEKKNVAGRLAQKEPPEKLVVVQVVKKFSTFDGARKFITVFTRARQISIS